MGSPDVGLAPSRLLPGSCTTRYGEAPDDHDVLGLVPDPFGTRPDWMPWFPAGQKDTPAGSVWTVFATTPVDPASKRNLSGGAEAGGDERPEIVLPEGLWAFTLLSGGKAATRSATSPSGTWFSRWDEGQIVSLEGPFAADRVPVRWSAEAVDGMERIGWKAPSPADLLRLAEDHPEAQMLSPTETVRRRSRLATRTSIARSASVVLVALFAGLLAQAPAWWASRNLAATERRLASVRPDIDRLERIRASIVSDAAFLAASSDALRPSASPLVLLDGISRRLPEGVRLLTFQLESPPGETGWAVRTDVRLPDWRGVASLVDSIRTVPGVADVRVQSQQRDQERVHLVLALKGTWP